MQQCITACSDSMYKFRHTARVFRATVLFCQTLACSVHMCACMYPLWPAHCNSDPAWRSLVCQSHHMGDIKAELRRNTNPLRGLEEPCVCATIARSPSVPWLVLDLCLARLSFQKGAAGKPYLPLVSSKNGEAPPFPRRGFLSFGGHGKPPQE